MKKKVLIIFLVNLLTLGFKETAAGQGVDYTVHANIIYHFTKYIDWPANKKAGDFVIGIVGDSPLFEELQKATANKTAGSQRIIIRRFSSSEISFNCQILYISEDESGLLKKIVSLTQNHSLLIVTEEEGLARKGSCINFIIIDDRLKLEINKKNIEKRNLKIAAEFLGLGVLIN